MPFYTYHCPKGHQVVELKKVDDRRNCPVCTVCGDPTSLRLTATQIAPVHGAGTGHSTATRRPPA